MSERAAVEGSLPNIGRFIAAMRAQSIHIGVGLGSGAVTCVTCHQLWPCDTERSHT